MKKIKSYAGIGSRNISEEESQKIKKLSLLLADRDYIVYSGNANGSDVSFQIGSRNKCVVMLPYKNFNKKVYNPWELAIDAFECGKTDIGNELTDELHPCPYKLSWNVKPFLNRNAHQILGYDDYPKVRFVVCCADCDDEGNEIGGTGHACRIARKEGITVVNIRKDENYKDKIFELIGGDNEN